MHCIVEVLDPITQSTRRNVETETCR